MKLSITLLKSLLKRDAIEITSNDSQKSSHPELFCDKVVSKFSIKSQEVLHYRYINFILRDCLEQIFYRKSGKNCFHGKTNVCTKISADIDYISEVVHWFKTGG